MRGHSMALFLSEVPGHVAGRPRASAPFTKTKAKKATTTV
jgi:hypothetical protein